MEPAREKAMKGDTQYEHENEVLSMVIFSFTQWNSDSVDADEKLLASET